MKLKAAFLIVFTLFVYSLLYPQFKSNNISHQQYNQSFTPTISLGLGGGIAYIEDNSGLAIGMFAELKTESFSFVPQANFWKIGDDNNFEAAGLVRLRFSSTSVEPYIDGGIGLNFYSRKNDSTKTTENKTNVGLDLGGGIEFLGIGSNYTLFVDAKYKIIVSEPNIKGYTLTGGLKFYF